jgi:TonB-linked SusC/RagA family outer membrane protein
LHNFYIFTAKFAILSKSKKFYILQPSISLPNFSLQTMECMTMFLKKSRSVILMAMVFLSFTAMAQKTNFSAKGSVKDESGSPMVGVTVQLKGTQIATISDYDGNYNLTGTVSEGEYLLTASFVGYSNNAQKVQVSASNSTISMDFNMSPDVLNLDELVVTGNTSTTTRKQLGNNISVIKGENLKNSGTTSALGALQGKVMGAQITQNSGDPAGGISVRLRGASSINGSSDPLYIIDGIIVDNSSQNVINRNADAQGTSFAAGQNRLVDINSADIERIEVLNGASAAALYGARAANGVVQIFTKRGKSDKTRIEFSTGLITSQLRKQIPMTTVGQRFGKKGNDRLETAQDRLTLLTTVGLTEAQLIAQNVKYQKGGYTPRIFVNDQYPVTRYNYWDDLFQSATGTENNLSFSGGNDKTTYYASIGYFNNDGIMKNTNFKKYNLRLNLDQTLSSWAKLSFGLGANFSKSKDMPNGNNFFNPISSVFIIDNVWNLNERDANGQLKQVEQVRMNPLSILETFDITQQTYRTMGNLKLSLYPTKGLTIDLIGGGDIYSLQGNEYHPRVPYGGVSADFFPDGYVSLATDNVMLVNNDLNITYNTNLTNDLTSTSMAGYQIQYNRNQYAAQDGRDLAPFGSTIAAANNLFNRPVQSVAERLISGAFIQQTFGFKEQVFVTLAGRLDKSSVFASANQNNFYPKISGSWVLTDYLSNKDIISSVKLRAAYGQAGNLTGIGAYSRFDNYNLSSIGGLASITPSTTFANPSVRPEKMTETEFGGDFAFLKNRLGLSINVYNQKITDLLLTKPVPPSIGGTSIVTNVSSDSTYMSNKGLEIMLNGTIVKTKDFKWDLGILYNTNSNTVYGIDGGFFFLRGGGGTQAVITGQPFGVFYGTYYARDASGNKLKTTQGLFQPERGTQTTANYAQGIVDRGTDGQPKVTGAGSTELRKVIGSPVPKWTGSLNTNIMYKSFSLYALLDAVQGVDIYNWNRITSNNVGWGPLAEQELKGEVPRGTVASIAGGINGGRIQEEHIEDGSFVKIRELSLSYDFGKVNKVFENVNVSLIGRNLYSFDNYQGFDPEANSAGQSDRVRGDDFGAMPIPRTIMVRLGVKF